MHYQLVPTTPKDQPWLEELRRAAYQDLFVATWGSWDEVRHLRHCAECWNRGDIYVIELEALRVGMIQLFEHADALEVGEIQIQPSYQGRGIGTCVLRDAITRAHTQGKTIFLSTGLRNHRAIELYRRLGFRCVEQSETHYHMECQPVA